MYGNFWIALGAALLTWQSRFLLGAPDSNCLLPAFVFCGTWSLYAVHRLVSLRLLGKLGTRFYRWQWMYGQQVLLLVYTLVGGLGAATLYLWLPEAARWSVLLPASLALGYAFPVFGKKRLLRDYAWLKSGVIAFSWAWVTAWLPGSLIVGIENERLLWLTLERFFFIYASCIPFDIRDMEQDRSHGTPTLATYLGVSKARILAVLALGVSALLAWGMFTLGVYRLSIFTGSLISLLIGAVFVGNAAPARSSLYFSLGVDGLLVLQPVLLYLSGLIG